MLPHTTLANRWTKSKLGSRISGFTISWVPYCATGQRARATMPTSRIWHRRSFHHSVWIIFHILDTSSNALALVDQRDQGQKHYGLRSGHQKRLGGGDEIGADPLQKSQHLCAGIGEIEILKVPAEGQRPG